jgi:hypothetical protein
MGVIEMNRELRDVKNVPWQLTAVLFALFFGLPLTVAGIGMLTVKGQGSSILAAIFAAPGVLTLLWGALGMRSRVRQANAAGEPTGPIAKKMLSGVALIFGTVAVVSAYTALVEIPSYVLAVPAGFVGVLPGIVMILRAMIPAKTKPTHAPSGVPPTSVVAKPVATVLPPRPRINR